MTKLNAKQIDNVRRYLCKHGAGFKSCVQCPFFCDLRNCNKRKKVLRADLINEIANAWENVKEQK